MQNNSIDSTIPNEWVTLFYQDKPIRIVIIDNKFSWTSVTDVIDALAYKTYRDGLRFLNEAVHFRKGEEIRLENGVLTQIDVINNSGIETLIKYAKASFRKPFKEWYRVHLSLTSVNEIRALAQQPREESKEQSIDFQIFTFGENQKTIRCFQDEKGNIWLVAKDVCDILELDNVSKACERLKDFEKTTITISDNGSNYKHPILIVSESGFYNLVFGSRKPEAENFRVWVTQEVLPTIRKTGKYEIVPKQETTAVGDFTPAQIETLRKMFLESEQRIQTKNEARFQPLETAMAYVMRVLPTLMPKVQKLKIAYVYMAQNTDNALTKIGKADKPPERIEVLELGGSKINLLKVVKFPSEELALYFENMFHTLFKPFGDKREWFKLQDFQHQIFNRLADALNAYYENLIENWGKNENTTNIQ